MLEPTPKNTPVPNWVWLACVPVVGSLAIAYAGNKTKTPQWIYLGAGMFTATLIIGSSNLGLLAWVAQVGVAFYLKNPFWQKLGHRNSLASGPSRAGGRSGKIDINDCSKDDLVRGLDLPIIYANDIESLKSEGYIFTHLEELSEIVGIPESYLPRLGDRVTFSYNPQKELECSWQRLNVMSIAELIAAGLPHESALKIVREREQHGEYRSVMDIKRRTGIPFQHYRCVVY
jgi:DNA uptake protein ComE-like DNA-binding protein